MKSYLDLAWTLAFANAIMFTMAAWYAYQLSVKLGRSKLYSAKLRGFASIILVIWMNILVLGFLWALPNAILSLLF